MIPLSKERAKHLNDAVTEEERANLRSAGMVQHWCARNVHYEALGGTSILSRHFNDATVQTIVDANKIAKHMRENKALGLIFKPIDPAEAVGGVSCDGKTQSKMHSCGVGTHRKVDEISKLCKADNIWSRGLNLLIAETQ